MGRGEYRTNDVLSSKWRDMNLKFIKFNGIYSKKWQTRRSGQSDAMIELEAEDQYREEFNAPFTLKRINSSIYQDKRTEPVVKMMEHKWRPVSIDQGSLTSLTSKRHKAGLSISPKERNEKLGEKIAALQQLVSPYGKTDTASVLLEAIEYIHFLHDQVKVCHIPSQSTDLDSYNMKGKGLCVVPISYTMGVASSNGADIWAPIKTPSAPQNHRT
ncbi:hypothetical protein E3N88_14966 [Mikania micrantha]|uniref:BHLH domain-containing protein n=1 Tax=Mikania micrantha TaxID=192012 RepID=A0A5N6P367_9ASTR|nr:hypothetical protein E3N88_14952 [Mikania micrantha]KAD5803606.1 hypothetical protein E3N88_14966 [Mikania micrantha]